MIRAVGLITGGTGFVGRHLTEYLLATQADTDWHLTSFGRNREFPTDLAEKVTIHQLDLTDLNATQTLVNQINPNKIYHLASISLVGGSFEQGSQIMQNNIKLQLNLLEAIKQMPTPARLLNIGSADGYGISLPTELPIKEDHPFRPVNPYAVSKVSQDLLAYAYATAHRLPVIRVRPFNHTGEGQLPVFVVPEFCRQIAAVERGEAEVVKVGDLSAIRDFTDVKDMVKAYALLMERGEVGEVYNIGSGVGIKIGDILERLIKLAKVEIKVEQDTSRLRPSDISEMVADSSKIVKLGWQPQIQLDKTLERVLNYWRNNR